MALRLLLSDPAAADLPEDQRLSPVVVATIGHPDGALQNIPAARGIEEQIEVRLNNAQLGRPAIEEGWLVFAVEPELFAAGENLVGVRVVQRPGTASGLIVVEKLEVRVAYRQEVR